MKLPEGFPNPGNKVCELTKSLYGLKQVSWQWFAKLVQELAVQGFAQSKNDYSLFIKKQNSNITLAVVYVGDMIVTGDDIDNIDQLKNHLDSVVSIKDLGKLGFFLGIKVSHLSTGICNDTKEVY